MALYMGPLVCKNEQIIMLAHLLLACTATAREYCYLCWQARWFYCRCRYFGRSQTTVDDIVGGGGKKKIWGAPPPGAPTMIPHHSEFAHSDAAERPIISDPRGAQPSA